MSIHLLYGHSVALPGNCLVTNVSVSSLLTLWAYLIFYALYCVHFHPVLVNERWKLACSGVFVSCHLNPLWSFTDIPTPFHFR